VFPNFDREPSLGIAEITVIHHVTDGKGGLVLLSVMSAEIGAV